jgi:hypothetical protein
LFLRVTPHMRWRSSGRTANGAVTRGSLLHDQSLARLRYFDFPSVIVDPWQYLPHAVRRQQRDLVLHVINNLNDSGHADDLPETL